MSQHTHAKAGAPHHVVVDGSNLATEGRATPSFSVLHEAVAAFRAENPDAMVTIVVDGLFAHRIDESERKPVPGAGWILSVRSPVRGVRASRAQRSTEAAESRARTVVTRAIAEAAQDAVAPATPRPRTRRRRRRGPPPGAVNEPDAILMFVVNHPLGSELIGRVERFTSHGAFVQTDSVACYVPLSRIGHPPKRARDVWRRGEVPSFVVQAVDPARRGVELALPQLAQVSARPCDETVEAEVEATRGASSPTARRRRQRNAERLATQ